MSAEEIAAQLFQDANWYRGKDEETYKWRKERAKELLS